MCNSSTNSWFGIHCFLFYFLLIFLSKWVYIWIYYFLYLKVDFPSIRTEFLSSIFVLLSFECFNLGASATLAGLVL